MAKIGVVGDIHAPVTHPAYLTFCRDIFDAWGVEDVVMIGDVVDWHAISFHAAHPDCPGPKDEYALAYESIQKWHTVFPKARVCIGNHDERVIRLAESVNIPAKFLRDYNEVWGTPKWEWAYDFQIDDTYYFHGTGNAGEHPAFNVMRKMCMSTVMGHIHTAAGVKWQANPNRRLFSMDTGCGIDDRAIAFAYGRHMKRRSMLGCGVVLDGVPYHEIMPCGRGEKYDRNKFKGKRS